MRFGDNLTDTGTQLTKKEFQEGFSVCGLHFTLSSPDHQEINVQVEVMWWNLRTIAYSIMVHAHVSDKYIHFTLMYKTHHLYPVIPINNLVNQDGKTTTPHKMATGAKPSVLNLRVLLCPYVVQKANAHVYGKALNIHHQSQKGFGISLWGLHNIKEGTSYMNLVHRKYFLHMMLDLTKHVLVR